MAPDPKEAASSSDDSSRSSSPESSAEAKPAVKENSKENRESEISSSSGSGQERSNSSDEGSSDEGSSDENGGNEPAQKQQSTKEPSKRTARPPQAFKPPSGFKSLKNQSPPSSEASSVISKTSGKQVFHITAPASLPLSKIKQVSLAKVLQGEPVLNHEGVNYGIPPGNINQGDLSDKKLLLYDPKAQTYYSSPLRNIPSYHVQEMISLPQTTKDSSNAASISQETAKPAKKQPKNLKMRFQPVGSRPGAAETIGTSSEESEGEKPTLKAPKRAGKETEERKRKHHHTEDGSQPSARKKSKKHTSAEGASAPPSSQMEVDGEPGHKKSKKSSKHRDEKKRKKSKETA